MRCDATSRFDSMDAPCHGQGVYRCCGWDPRCCGLSFIAKQRGMTPMMDGWTLSLAHPYAWRAKTEISLPQPRMFVGGPEKQRRISLAHVCGGILCSSRGRCAPREGNFFLVSERVAWDAVRERTTREGACGCAFCTRRGDSDWRGVAWRYVARPGFLGFRVQARHGKLHAQLAGCMHACAPRTVTHAVGARSRPPGAAWEHRTWELQSTQVRAGSLGYVMRAVCCLSWACRPVRLSRLSRCPCEWQLRADPVCFWARG